MSQRDFHWKPAGIRMILSCGSLAYLKDVEVSISFVTVIDPIGQMLRFRKFRGAFEKAALRIS